MGSELVGFLNMTYYPHTGATSKLGYNPALVTLDIKGNNLTLKGQATQGVGHTVLRHITSVAGGNSTRLEGLRFIDPGWDGLYARGVVGLTLKDCVFVSTPAATPLHAAARPLHAELLHQTFTHILRCAGPLLPERHQRDRCVRDLIQLCDIDTSWETVTSPTQTPLLQRILSMITLSPYRSSQRRYAGGRLHILQQPPKWNRAGLSDGRRGS